jgi:hypothetical protein
MRQFLFLGILAIGCVQYLEQRPYNFAAVADRTQASGLVVQTLNAQGMQSSADANGLVSTGWERVRYLDVGTQSGVYLARYTVTLTQGSSKALAIGVRMDLRQCPLGTSGMDDAVARACPRTDRFIASDQQRVDQLGHSLEDALKVQGILNE